MLRTLHHQLSSQLADTNAAAAGLARLVATLRTRWQETIQANLRLRAALHQTVEQASKAAAVRPCSSPLCCCCCCGAPRLRARMLRRLARCLQGTLEPGRASARGLSSLAQSFCSTTSVPCRPLQRNEKCAIPHARQPLFISWPCLEPAGGPLCPSGRWLPLSLPQSRRSAVYLCGLRTPHWPPLQPHLLPRCILWLADRLASAHHLQRCVWPAAQGAPGAALMNGPFISLNRKHSLAVLPWPGLRRWLVAQRHAGTVAVGAVHLHLCLVTDPLQRLACQASFCRRAHGSDGALLMHRWHVFCQCVLESN